MANGTEGPTPTPAPPGPPAGLRRRRLLVLVALAAAALGGGAYWFARHRAAGPAPPEVDLTGVDPVVAAAVEQARQTVRQKPRSATAWGHLGMVLSAHNFRAAAETAFAQAERLDPGDCRWPYFRATLLLAEDRDAALPGLSRAADLCGQDVGLRLRLAETLWQQGRLPEAESQFRRVLEQDPGNPRVHLGLARLDLQAGRLPESREHLRHCLDSPFTRRAAHTVLAAVTQRLGDSGATAEELRLVSTLPEDVPWPDPYADQVARLRVGKEERAHRSRQLVQAGLIPEALDLLQEALRDDPGDAAAWNLLGQIRLQQHDLSAAEAAFASALRAAPESANDHFYLGLTLMQQGRTPEAAASFRRAVEIQPGLAVAHAFLGRCLVRQGDQTGAIRELRTAVRYEPQNAQGHLELAALLIQAGQDAEAREQLQTALQLNPANAKARELLGQVQAGSRSGNP